MEHVERDLIFAIQAVQMGLATKDVLVEAGLAWSRDREPPLRQLVIERAGLDDDDVELLDGVVTRMLKQDGWDVRRTLQRLGGREKVFESFGGAHLAQDDTIRSLLADPETAEEEIPLPADRVTQEHAGRYDIRSEHARGGIGSILVAFDEHVGREIAIKELIPERGGSLPDTPPGRTAAVAARFLREARVTGQLEHPNIVPVYEVGRRNDGTLYYTMKLVRGKTLARALDECRSLEERLRLLRHYVDLCNAIAYAHSRGVIHRDIKTDNVMVGEFGETVVLDWGLAKARGQQDSGDQELQREIRIFQEAAPGKTVDGRAIGTPAYMSPEQAEGHIEAIDERSDVWSLGAVLYELLTGRPPFEGVNAFEIIGKVIREPVIPPRELDPAIPPDLASICEKALLRDKDSRYQRAQDISEEVEAYQSGARVTAYEYSSWELFKRMVNANRALTGAVSLVLVVLVVGSAIIFRAYRTAEEARDSEKRARIAAERNLAAKVSAQRRATVASRQLARAYQATAEREIAVKDFTSARIYAAAALLFHPANPLSPYHYLPDSDSTRPAVQTLLDLQHILFTVATHSVVERREVIPVGPKPAYSIAFSPSGKVLAAAAADGTVRLFDRASRRLLARLPGHGKLALSVAFSPDGRLLASAGADGRVRLWDVTGRRALCTFEGHTASVLAVAFSADGRTLASAGKDRVVRLWDVSTRRAMAALRGHEDTVFALAFSPGGRLLASAGSDQTVRLWSRAIGSGSPGFRRVGVLPVGGGVPMSAGPAIASPAVLRAHKGSIFSIAFSPDGKLLASAGADETVRLWDVVTRAPAAVLRGHEKLVRSVAFSPSGTLLATASFDQTLRIWSVSERRVVSRQRGHFAEVDGVAFAPGGLLVASCGRDRTIRLWHLRSRSRLVTLVGHKDLVEAVAVSPDGRLLASASYDHSVRLWDLDHRREIRMLHGHRRAVTAVAFSPDGKLLASGGRDHQVRLWRPTTGVTVALLSGHRGAVHDLAFSPDGRLLATASADHTVRLWNVAHRKAVGTLGGHGHEVFGVAFSPDGRLLATAGFDETIRFWRLPGGEPLHTLKGPEGYAFRLAFSPDGQTLAAARRVSDDEAEVELWSVASRRLVSRLRGHTRLINRLAFSPDGKLLISGSRDKSIRLWETASGRPVQVLEHARPITAVALTPDGSRMVVGDWKTIKVYPVVLDPWRRDPKKLLDEAQREGRMVLEEHKLRPRRGKR